MDWYYCPKPCACRNVLLEGGDICRACLADLGVAQCVGNAANSMIGFCTTHAGSWQAAPAWGWVRCSYFCLPRLTQRDLCPCSC